MPKRDYLTNHAPEVLQQIADHAAHVIATEMGVDGGTAVAVAQEIAKRIAQVFGGCRINIPTGTWNGQSRLCFDLTKRDLAIYRAFNGQNREEVMARFGISKSRLYEINQAVSAHLQAGSRPEIARLRLTAELVAPPQDVPALTPVRESA